MAKYIPGDYIKVEFSDEATAVAEWMWVRLICFSCSFLSLVKSRAAFFTLRRPACFTIESAG